MLEKENPKKIVDRLVRSNLAFFNLNKLAETRFSLSLVQYHILSQLREMPATSPQKLAECAGIHPSTITQTLKRLERKKLIFSTENPKDSRKKLLGITVEGARTLSQFENGFDEIILDYGSDN